MSGRHNRRNYYRILHVQPDAPGPVLKSSYRALMLSMEMHPDRGGDHWDAALINEAYAVLSDPVQRAEYDRTLDLASIRRERPSSRSAAAEDAAHADRVDDPVDAVDEPCCLFCGSERATIGALPGEATCLDCRSPLSPAGEPHLEASDRRAAHRVAKSGAIRYYLTWPQASPHLGRIVDLSPRGVQFESRAPIDLHRIIKIEGSLVDAIGRVATCRERDGGFAIGAEFYTVRFHRPRGTFVSTRA